MEIKKKFNDLVLEKDNMQLRFFFAGNLDLYISIINKDLFKKEKNVLTFDITPENYEIYQIFDELYLDIINGNSYENKDALYEFKRTMGYAKLVNKNCINWISDGEIDEYASIMTISAVNNDTYRLTFRQKQNSDSIYVRFSNFSSRYYPFNNAFMLMYEKLQAIEPDYHQIHFKELEYKQKEVLKRLKSKGN